MKKLFYSFVLLLSTIVSTHSNYNLESLNSEEVSAILRMAPDEIPHPQGDDRILTRHMSPALYDFLIENHRFTAPNSPLLEKGVITNQQTRKEVTYGVLSCGYGFTLPILSFKYDNLLFNIGDEEKAIQDGIQIVAVLQGQLERQDYNWESALNHIGTYDGEGGDINHLINFLRQ